MWSCQTGVLFRRTWSVDAMVWYSFLCANSVMSARARRGIYKGVLNFDAFFSSYIDRISEITAPNIDNFRVQPTYTLSPTSFEDPQHFEEFALRYHNQIWNGWMKLQWLMHTYSPAPLNSVCTAGCVYSGHGGITVEGIVCDASTKMIQNILEDLDWLKKAI